MPTGKQTSAPAVPAQERAPSELVDSPGLYPGICESLGFIIGISKYQHAQLNPRKNLMPKVSDEAIRAFSEGIEKCTNKIGGGKVGIDSACLRVLIRNNRDAAYRYVELHCLMAESQPGYLQPAIIVASAYQIEFGDDSLYQMVMVKVKELEAEGHIQSIGYAKSLEEATAEPPERVAAKAWWQKSGQTEGRCDNCYQPLRRGEGYLIEGRSMMIGATRVDMGEEIICQNCFTSLE
jgi:hypothetical protein